VCVGGGVVLYVFVCVVCTLRRVIYHYFFFLV
jgi:hypothetical protein